MACWHEVTVHDPHVGSEQALHEFGISLVVDALDRRYVLVLLALPHCEYLALGPAALLVLVNHGGTLADLKGELAETIDWTLLGHSHSHRLRLFQPGYSGRLLSRAQRMLGFA